MSSVSFDLVILNELTLGPIIWRAITGRRVVVAAVEPALPGARGLLESAFRFLERRRLVIDVFEAFPEFRLIKKQPPKFAWTNDTFRQLEPWQAEHFRFTRIDRAFPGYALSIKHATCSYVGDRLHTFLVFEGIMARHAVSLGGVLGCDRDLVAMLSARGSAPAISQYARGHRIASAVTNGFLALLMAAYGASLIARRVALRTIAPRRYFFGTNYINPIGNKSNFRMVRDIVDNDDQVCVVYHERAQAGTSREIIGGFHECHVEDGRLSPREAWSSLRELLSDIMSLLRFVSWRPAHFQIVLKLPLKRQKFRAFFARHHFDFFWTRDDYDEAHILRSQELRRVGGRALGMTHGLPMTEIINARWRYIDLDVYYTISDDLYRTHYVPYWPARMTVRPVGSFGMPRSRYACLGMPRSKDVVFFISPTLNDERIKAAVIELASALPDRTIWLRLRRGKVVFGFFEDLIMREDKPSNIQMADGEEHDSYDLMTRHQYSIGTTSTVSVEAIQFGMIGFVLDTQPDDHTFYYREYPGLCEKSGAVIARRIRAIEKGEEVFRRESFRGLVDISGRNPFDIVRADIGLPPRGVGAPGNSADAASCARAAAG